MKRLQLLISLLFVCAVVALCLPLFDMVYLYPATSSLLNEKVRLEAEHLGRYLAQDFAPQGEAEKLQGQLYAMVDSFALLRASIRTPSGEVLFSTDPQQLGQRRDTAFFRRALRRGEAYSRQFPVQLEQGKEVHYLLETQSPIIQEGDLVAVLELIHDISGQRQQLDQALSRASLFLFIAAALLMAGIVQIVRLARQSIRQQGETELLLQESRLQLETKHKELNQIFSLVEHAKNEWQITLDCIADMILLVDAAGRVKRCNQALIEFVDRSYLAVLGKDWKTVLFSEGIEVHSLSEQRGRIYHPRQKVWLLIEFFPSPESAGEQLTVIRIQRQGSTAAEGRQ